MKIINETELSNLFLDNQRRGQEIFPELIKKLIVSSVNSQYARFPSGDAIYAPGFDGVVTSISVADKYVPFGDSIWELGTNKGYKKKANSDFKKRTEIGAEYDKSEYSFVFCTPHIWSGNLTEWENECDAKGVWKKVKIIDGSILADWLESNFEVAIWLFNQFNRNLNNVANFEMEVNRIFNLTEPKLNAEILICSNKENSKAFVEELNSKKSKRIIIKANTNREQGYFFILGSLAYENNQFVNSRVLIVDNKEDLKELHKICHGKIIVINFDSADYINERDNSYVYIVTDDVRTSTLQLEPIFYDDFAKSVETMGVDIVKAYEIASKVNRNISCLKRHLAVNPMLRKPLWAEELSSNDIIPIALLSEFDSERESDQMIVSKLINCDFASYIDKLEELLMVADSPIFKVGTTYKIYSKEECFKVLQIKFNSPKVQMMEGICLSDLCVKNNGREYVISNISQNMLEGIFTSFAILSNDESSHSHYDQFIAQFIVCLSEESALLNSNARLFLILSEISANAMTAFVSQIIEEDNIRNELSAPIQNSFSNSCNMLYIFWAMEQCLSRKDYAVGAMRVLLDLYLSDYKGLNCEQINRSIIDAFTPAMSQFQTLSPTDKLNILMKKSEDFDDIQKHLAEKIYDNMRIGSVSTLAHPIVPKWVAYKKRDMSCRAKEYVDIDKQVTGWLIKNAENKVMLFESLLDRNFFGSADCVLINEKFKIVKNTLIDADISCENKRKINAIAYSEINRYERYRIGDACKNKCIIDNFTKIYECTVPDNLFDKYKFFFEDSGYDIIFKEDNDESVVSGEAKLARYHEIIGELIDEYGESIIKRIIEVSNEYNSSLFYELFKFVGNKLEFCDMLFNMHKNQLLAIYFSTFDKLDAELRAWILAIVDEERKYDIIIRLPINDDVVEFIEANNLDAQYWTNKNNQYNKISTKTYEKLLIYAPMSLLHYALQLDNNEKYSVGLEVLRAIIKQKSSHNDIQFKHSARIDSGYYISQLIDSLDRIYYTEDLVSCEWELLGVYNSSGAAGILPRGIREYFWRNPNELYNMFNTLFYKSRDGEIGSDSVGAKLVYDSMIQFGNYCLIPHEYIISEPNRLKDWCETILKLAEVGDRDILSSFKVLIINTLAMCPETAEQNVWPTQAVADILDNMVRYYDKQDIDRLKESYRGENKKIDAETSIISTFSCAKQNTIGVRSVLRGEHEFNMSEQYMAYSEAYKISNRVTSHALYSIAMSYSFQGERDRNRAILGQY